MITTPQRADISAALSTALAAWSKRFPEIEWTHDQGVALLTDMTDRMQALFSGLPAVRPREADGLVATPRMNLLAAAGNGYGGQRGLAYVEGWNDALTLAESISYLAKAEAIDAFQAAPTWPHTLVEVETMAEQLQHVSNAGLDAANVRLPNIVKMLRAYAATLPPASPQTPGDK